MTTLTSHSHAGPFPATRLLVPGAVGGLLGGMAMAMFSMLVAISRDGFWSPVRGITSVVFGDQHYGGGFDFWESGMDMNFADNLYDSFRIYQSRISGELDRMAREYGFVQIDAARPVESIFESLKTEIAKVF